MGAEGNSASQSEMEKPLNTPEMSVHEAKAMLNSMLRDSPLPNLERAIEGIPEGGRSDKPPEGGEGEKLPEGGNEKQSKETPTGKLVAPCRRSMLLLALSVIK